MPKPKSYLARIEAATNCLQSHYTWNFEKRFRHRYQECTRYMLNQIYGTREALQNVCDVLEKEHPEDYTILLKAEAYHIERMAREYSRPDDSRYVSDMRRAQVIRRIASKLERINA
jgi:hypothetical protein